jgi:hypothetical protein
MDNTPAPWNVTKGGCWGVEGPDDYGHICTLEDYDVAEADARLIAAAPVMWRALLMVAESGIEELGEGEGGDVIISEEAFVAVKKAIALAEGK